MTMEGDSSNSAVMETFGKYIVKIAEYFRDFEILHREEDQATEEETSSGNYCLFLLFLFTSSSST